jgi:urease gamma subunit
LKTRENIKISIKKAGGFAKKRRAKGREVNTKVARGILLPDL